ncbi:lipopolysaccharide-induced tumor necrosis factor-alpha factor homolog [Mustelus asterias]
MESKGDYGAPPPNYTDAMQPPSYQGNPGQPPYPAGPPGAGYPPYPAGPPMAGPGMSAPQPPVVVQTVYVQPSQHFGFLPIQTTCPGCNQLVLTRVSHSPGALTWLSCGGLFLVGCVLGCCLIPFCVDGLQDVDHNCPNCGRHIGSCKRL